MYTENNVPCHQGLLVSHLVGVQVGRFPDHALDAASPSDDLVDGHLEAWVAASGDNIA